MKKECKSTPFIVETGTYVHVVEAGHSIMTHYFTLDHDHLETIDELDKYIATMEMANEGAKTLFKKMAMQQKKVMEN